MAALTVAQIHSMRRQVGASPDDAGLQEAYDRLGSTTEAVLEILETRLADLEATPAQFSVSGEYSQSTAENIKALTAKIGQVRSDGSVEDGVGHGVRFDQPRRQPCR